MTTEQELWQDLYKSKIRDINIILEDAITSVSKLHPEIIEDMLIKARALTGDLKQFTKIIGETNETR